MKTRIGIRIAGMLFIPLMFSAGMFSSCKMEEDDLMVSSQRVEAAPVFHATIEGAQSTKVFTDEQLHVLWNANDSISIFPKITRNKKYRFTGIDGATGGDFEEQSTGFGTGQDIDFNYAVYPYNPETGFVFAVNSDDADHISTTFPKVQAWKSKSFGPNANLMVAKSSTTDLSFKNVGAYLKLQIYGEGFSVRSIILQGNSGEPLSGPVNVRFGAEDVPLMAFDESDLSKLNTTIVLKADTPVALGSTASDAVAFWMVVPPGTLSGGFTVTVIDGNGNMHVKKTSSSFTFVRNQLETMKPFSLSAVPANQSPQGIHPFTGTDYAFDKTTDQVNIAEVDGNAWARFLLVPTLKMYELGPIPTTISVGTTFDATLTEYVEGVQNGTPAAGRYTVNSLSGGMMNLVSDEGNRIVVRY